MHTRNFSNPFLFASAFALSATVPLLTQAQAAAPADMPASTNAAPAMSEPAATPAPAPAADTATAPAERPTSYTIVSGDSLWTIAHKFDTTVVKLRKLNKLKKGALLHPGQVLQIPPANADSTK